MTDPPIPPEAIHVWTCDECGRQWAKDRPSTHLAHGRGNSYAAAGCSGTVTERVYVDLAAVDREAWAKRIGGAFGVYSYPEGSTGRQSGERTARAVVDALLGPDGNP